MFLTYLKKYFDKKRVPKLKSMVCVWIVMVMWELLDKRLVDYKVLKKMFWKSMSWKLFRPGWVTSKNSWPSYQTDQSLCLKAQNASSCYIFFKKQDLGITLQCTPKSSISSRAGQEVEAGEDIDFIVLQSYV